MNKKKILVVDDEPTITRQLKLQLEHTGKYEVHAENDGPAALRAAPAFNPDLALLDLVMPGMDGTDLKNSLHEIPDLHSLPIVFLSAMASPDVQNDRDVFISKPASVSAIIERIDEQFDRGTRTAQNEPT